MCNKRANAPPTNASSGGREASLSSFLECYVAASPMRGVRLLIDRASDNHIYGDQMFDLLLQDADELKARKWLTWSGLITGGQGVTSVSALITRIKGLLPEHLVLEQFTFMALAIAIATVLPLAAFRKVISVSLAQLGVATSLMYLGFSLTGAFQAEYRIVITMVLILVATVFFVLFYSGIQFIYRQGRWSDFFLGVLLLLSFAALWLYPIWAMWR